MRQRVSAILVIVLLGVMPALAQHPAHTTVTPDTLKWAEPAVLPGSKLAVVQGDPSKEGPFVYRLKMPAGYKIPAALPQGQRERHRAGRRVLHRARREVRSGLGQELTVGSFVSVPPKHPHYAWAGGQETVVQVHGVGPTDLTFVNPADDPRKK